MNQVILVIAIKSLSTFVCLGQIYKIQVVDNCGSASYKTFAAAQNLCPTILYTPLRLKNSKQTEELLPTVI